MFTGLFNSICSVGIFMISAQTILHFRPKAVYDKYLKLLISVMVLIQLLRPVMGLFGSMSMGEFEERVVWFDEQLKEGIYIENEYDRTDGMTDAEQESVETGTYVEPIEEVQEIVIGN